MGTSSVRLLRVPVVLGAAGAPSSADAAVVVVPRLMADVTRRWRDGAAVLPPSWAEHSS